MQYLSLANSSVVLFDNTHGSRGFTPPPTILVGHMMDINFTDLKEASDSTQINFSEGSSAIFNQTNLSYKWSGKRYGIELRLDKSSYWIVDFDLQIPSQGCF